MKNNFELGRNFHEYIKKNSSADVRGLILAAHGRNHDFPVRFAVTQIECRQKTSRKLSSFISHDEFLFPSVQAAEQATHQCVAAYHARLVGSGKRIADLTGGLGIDAFTLAANGNSVTACELDAERAEVLSHNAKVLGLTDIRIENVDSIEWLRQRTGRKPFDMIFVDPARRDAADRRKFVLRDCLPDIVGSWDTIRSSARRIMVKASPLLDIECALQEIPGIEEIHLVCVKGECKEVLLIAAGTETAGSADTHTSSVIAAAVAPAITAVDLDDTPDASLREISRWECTYDALGTAAPIADISAITPGTYLYDPNAAVHKLRCASALCEAYPGLFRVAANTDLYWSAELIEDFPGRRFRIESVPDSKEIKKLKGSRREVAVRNYPLTAEQLRTKLKVLPGGNENFIYGCRAGEKGTTLLLDCIRV